MTATACAPQRVSETSDGATKNENPERIALLSQELAGKMDRAVQQIRDLNVESRILSFNAQIEAARSGAAGATFGVVALAMRELSGATAKVAESVSSETRGTLGELERISKVLATNVRGTRLSDLALVNIDLIDRNLYERSCDCRWWATDTSLVDALTTREPEAVRFASHRMGIILNSYTVYFDLVLADRDGNIVANGRPQQYSSLGQNCSQSKWFSSAMSTQSGEEFGFQEVHESTLVSGERVLVYSAGVREGGEANGKLLGVLGIVFKWDALAQTIVTNTPLPEGEKLRTRVCICDSTGFLLADSRGRQLKESLQFDELDAMLKTAKHFIIAKIGGRLCCVAHAKSPGFETYATGWHSILIQELETTR
jgi:hypothetical protein